MSETAKYRHLTAPYCLGNGVDIGSQGDPVVPWAISVDLPPSEFATYCNGSKPENAIHWGGDCRNLPFKDGTLDFVYSSHLLEDFEDWIPCLKEWIRVLKLGGNLVILIPDRELFLAAIAAGQPPNCAHRHEGRVGELTRAVRPLWKMKVLLDSLTNSYPGDYTILFVAKKT